MIQHLYLLEPPYSRLRAAKPGALPLGTVIVADLTAGGRQSNTRRAVTVLDALALQDQAPWCPLCFSTDGAAPDDALLDALDGVRSSAAWIVTTTEPDSGTSDTLPTPAEVVEAVRARIEPGAADLRAYVERRLGPVAGRALEDCFAEALRQDEVDPAALAASAGIVDLEDRAGWEWAVEAVLRARGYVRDDLLPSELLTERA